jgi:serine/threonine protein kinase
MGRSFPTPRKRRSTQKRKASSAKKASRIAGNASVFVALVKDLVSGKIVPSNEEEQVVTELLATKECSAKLKACLLSEGAYGFAYKLEDKKDKMVVKLPKGTRGFDIIEMEMNLKAYETVRRAFPNHSSQFIAQALGYWKSAALAESFQSRNFAFVYKYEDSLSAYADLIREKQVSPVDFKSIVFQVALALWTLQKHMPGFCHNDMHGDNVLITRNSQTFTYTHGGTTVRHGGKYGIKILDFGMSSTAQKVTDDGKALWKDVRNNPVVDFLMFCNRTLVYASAGAKRAKAYSPWHQPFLHMLERHFVPEVIQNGKGTGQWLDHKYLYISMQDGLQWVNKTYPPGSHPMSAILKDPFFS